MFCNALCISVDMSRVLYVIISKEKFNYTNLLLLILVRVSVTL